MQHRSTKKRLKNWDPALFTGPPLPEYASTSELGQQPSKAERGIHSEILVEASLVAQGWTVLRRRWVTPWGEVDRVFGHRRTLLLVEVKARSSMAHLEHVISWRQRQRLLRVWQNVIEAYPGFRVEYHLAVVLWDGRIHWDTDFLGE